MNSSDYHIITASSPQHPVMFQIQEVSSEEDPHRLEKYCLDVMTNNRTGKANQCREIVGEHCGDLVEQFCNTYGWNGQGLRDPEDNDIEIHISGQRRNDDSEYDVETILRFTTTLDVEIEVGKVLGNRISQILNEWELVFQ